MQGMWLNRTWFLRLSVLLSVLAVVVLSYVGVRTFRVGPTAKYLGWAATWKNGSWLVKTVDPAGPAAGKLAPSDRILAINGDARAQRIGPVWYLRDRPAATSYTIQVERDGRPTECRLDWPFRHDRGMQALTWIHLLCGAVFLAVGLIVAFARPDYLAARRALECAVLSSGFFALICLNRDDGMLFGASLAVAMALYAIIPFHVLAGYRFSAVFPANLPRTGLWRAAEIALYAGAVLVWLPVVHQAALRVAGGDRAVDLAGSQYPLSVYSQLWFQPLEVIFIAFCAVAIVAVCWRNYACLTEPGLRRRMRWMFFGMGASIFPVILLAPFFLLSAAATRQGLIEFINIFAIVSPLCVAYAIFKHRVLGIRVVLRAGLQYLLARNVLRVGLAVPALIIIATAVTHPGQTLAELAFGPIGKLDLVLLVITGVALNYRTALLNRIDRRFFREAYRQDQIFVALGEAIHRAADVPEISRLLSSQIDAALHPSAIFAVSREGPEEFAVVYSSSQDGSRSVQEFGIPLAQVESLDSSLDVPSLSDAERVQYAALEALGIELLVPIRGPNEGLIGLVLLGPKRSEEPYSGNDRRLLDTIAAQTGVAWENLQLRERLKHERAVRQKVVASIEGGPASVVMECPACGACYDGDTNVCQHDGRALTLSLPIPRTIDGKYALSRLIGRGGMGAVYKATDLRLDRTVAVKIMVGDLFGHARALQRFAREARASAKLDHPNVVRIFDFGELPGGGAYLVLEYLQGLTLRREIRNRGMIPPGEASPLVQAICYGIEAAHSRHVIHRDLKPENIFLVRDSPEAQPVAKILDFGLAVVRDLEFSGQSKLTQPGAAIGTVGYMSREQFLGEAVDERSDIFSLGIVAFEMLTGEVRLRGPWFSQAANVVPERLQGAGSHSVHHQIAAVLLHAMAEHRDDRYASVREFREALLPLLDVCPPFCSRPVAVGLDVSETADGWNPTL